MTTVRQLLAKNNIDVSQIEKMAIINKASIQALNNLPAVQILNKALQATAIVSSTLQNNLNRIVEENRSSILNALNSTQKIYDNINHINHVKNINFLMPQHRIIDDEDIDENNIYTPKPQIIHQNTQILKSIYPVDQYILEYNPYRQELVLNSQILTRLRFDSENQNIIEYVFNKPNKNISKEELQEKALGGAEFRKTLHQILYDVKIRGDIKKRFFKVNKNTIRYTP